MKTLKYFNPIPKAELMAELTMLLSDRVIDRQVHKLSKDKQIKLINDLADDIFILFNRNLIFKRKDK